MGSIISLSLAGEGLERDGIMPAPFVLDCQGGEHVQGKI
jgi:hypothetical protein